MATDMGFGRLFDDILGSTAIGATKPDDAFFERVTARLGIEPHAILFWDETARNVEAARSFGWAADQHESFATFKPVRESFIRGHQ